MEVYAKVGDVLSCPYCIMPLYRMREQEQEQEQNMNQSILVCL